MNPFESVRSELLQQVPGLRSAEVLPVVPSTNTIALERLRTGTLSAPAAIIALQQSAGRGQAGRPWHSPPGNLMGSWIVSRPPSISEPGLWIAAIAAAAPLAVCEVLATNLPPPRVPQIKWPNDVLVHDRKIAGILIESTSVSGQFRAVIGIGVNVNAPFPAPSADVLQLRQNATSVRELAGRPVDLTGFACQLTSSLLAQVELAARDPEPLWAAYHKRLRHRNCRVTVRTPAGEIAGRCEGVSPMGALLVHNGSATLAVPSGRITSFQPASFEEGV